MTGILMRCILTMIIPFLPLHTSQQNWSCWKRITYNDGIKKVDLLDSDTALIYPHATNNAYLISDDKTITIDHTHYWWQPLVHHKTNLILSSDTKTSATLWNFKGEKIHTYETIRLWSVNFNKEGTLFAELASDQSYKKNVISIRTTEGAIAKQYTITDKNFTSIYIHPYDENILYAHDSSNEALYWIDRREEKIFRLTTDSIKKISLNDNNMLIGAICSGLARIYDHRTRKGINLADFHEPLSAVFNSSGSHLLTRNYGHECPISRVWDAGTILQAKKDRVYADNTKHVTTLRYAENGHFSPGGNSIVAHYYDGYSDKPNPQNTVDVYTLGGIKLGSFTQKKRIVDAYFDRLGDNIIVHEPEKTVSIWKNLACSKSTSDQSIIEVFA